MKGKLIGVGVGPGDPSLMTLKAVKTIEDNNCIALPGKIPQETTAYKIAVQAVPSIEDKKLLPLNFPMVMDRKKQEEHHKAGAREIEKVLDTGENVVFLTLGDVTIYSTFTYVQHFVKADGYETKMINGIPSFCAAAAALGIPLAEWTQPLHIIPAVHRLEEEIDWPGNYVLMKSGTKMKAVKEKIRRSARRAVMIENCCMPDERRYPSLDEIPDEPGYFSLMIAKEDEPGYDK